MNVPAQKVRYGKYWLLRRLAKGGMAEVFLAMPAEPGREAERLAIKRVLPEISEEEEFLQMFLDEARMAGQLSHPGIVRIFDLGVEEDHLYIAMEYIDGRDLDSLARANKRLLSPALAARIALEVCAALAYAHEAVDRMGRPMRLVHRDVTPENVMITVRGEVKLVDFGVARADSKLSRTQPGMVKGKLNYIAPEQILGKELDGRADLFSLGAALYEVTTATRPFERGNMQDTVTAILNDKPWAPERILPGYPPALSAIVMRALEKDRDKRFASAAEMRDELERFLASVAPPVGAAELASLVASTPPTQGSASSVSAVPQRASTPRATTPPSPSQPGASVSRPPGSAPQRLVPAGVLAGGDSKPPTPTGAHAAPKSGAAAPGEGPHGSMLTAIGVLVAVLSSGFVGHIVTAHSYEARIQDLEARLRQPPQARAAAAPGPDASVPAREGAALQDAGLEAGAETDAGIYRLFLYGP